MSCKQLACEGAEELFKLVETEKSASRIFVLCTGSEDPTTKKSWCPDCVKGKVISLVRNVFQFYNFAHCCLFVCVYSCDEPRSRSLTISKFRDFNTQMTP